MGARLAHRLPVPTLKKVFLELGGKSAAIVLDVAALRTLPERQLRAALGECVKMAVLGDERLFTLRYDAPGAPALAAGADWRPGAERLRQAITRFQSHSGPLKPHFAYGTLDKGDFALAHAMHIANHQDEIVGG